MSTPGKPRMLEHVLFDRSFRTSRSEVTLHNYQVALARWVRVAGVRFVADVTAEAASRFVQARLVDVKPESVCTEYHALMALLDHEERAGRFDEVLLRRLRRLAPRLARKRELCAPFLTREQVEAAIKAAPYPGAKLAIRLIVLTGLRAGEATALEWADVDLQRRILSVRRGKTGARLVPLSRAAIDLLDAARPADGRGGVLGIDSADPRRMLQWWMERTTEVGPVAVRSVLLRHTAASWWVAAGVPLAKVAKWLGHSTFVCARYYAGLGDEYDADVERGATA